MLNMFILLSGKMCQQQLGVPADESHGVCDVMDLVFWLMGTGRNDCRHLALRALQWIGLMMDHQGWFETLDDNVWSTPLPMGNNYDRRVPNRLKEAVVQTAGRGHGLRSGAHVLKVLSKFGSKKFKAMKYKKYHKGNYWTEPITRR